MENHIHVMSREHNYIQNFRIALTNLERLTREEQRHKTERKVKKTEVKVYE